jgi:prepilin-type processing-associated H-X9-DG protein
MYWPVRSRGLTWIEVVMVLVVFMVLWFVFSLLAPAYHRERNMARRVICADQLSRIGKAMLSYADDYNGALPVAGGKGTNWGAKLRNWSASSRAEAFGLDPNSAGGEATIGASLYLLVRNNGLGPESFICPVDKKVAEFRPQKYGVTNRSLADLWDFGPNPARHCSYSYHMPYGKFALTTSNEPGYAVAADRNPWIDSPFAKAKDFLRFKPDVPPFNGTAEQANYGNTFRHAIHQNGDGQNVLFLDSHVEFARRAYCSIEDDNIYTVSSSPSAGNPLGTPPKLGSEPANRKDSLLVNDPPLPGR